MRFSARHRLFVFLLIMSSLALPDRALAQSTGTIRGIVRDASGGVLPGASVLLLNLATDQRQETVSAEGGTYSFVFLPPGEYRLQVQLTGFKLFTRDKVQVNIAAVQVLDVVMQIASLAEDIVVTGVSPQLQVTTAALGGLVENAMVTAVPLSSRNFTQVLALSAGVTGDIPDAGALGRNSVNISSNGARPFQNSMVMDGVVVDNPMSVGFDDASDKTGVPVPAPDAIQEFRVQTGLYDSEYGRQGGAVVNVVTKSGGNRFAGSGYEFFRNDALNANEFFRNRTGQSKPVLKQNQFGGTLGGPIRRDKVFFFASYQGTRQTNGGASVSTRSVFFPALGDRSAAALGRLYGGRSGTFGGVAVAPDGSNINPVAIAILNARLPNGEYLIPNPQTVQPNGTGFSAFSFPAEFKEDQIILNGDYNLSRPHRLSTKFFFATFPSTLPFVAGGANVPGFGEHDTKSNINARVAHTWVINNSTVNDAHFGYTGNRFTETPTEPLLATDIGMTPAVREFTGVPTIGVTGFFTVGLASNNDQHTFIHSYEFADTLNLERGRQSIRLGATVNPVFVDRYDPFQTRGVMNFSSFPDFLLGMSAAQNGTAFSNVSSATVGNGIHHRRPRFLNMAAFAQDDLRFNDRLSLNLGLRWQFNSQEWDADGHLAGFDYRLVPLFQTPPPSGSLRGFAVPANADLLGKSLPSDIKRLPYNRLTDHENWLGFSPRLGATWRPINSKKDLIVRGGYGVFYSAISGSINEQAWFGPWFVFLRSGGADVPSATFQNPFPNVPPSDAFPVFLPYTYPPIQSVFAVSPLNRQPYTQQWSVNVQQQIGTWLVEVGYVGSRSSNLLGNMRPNQAVLASPEHPVNGETTNTVQNRNLRVPVVGFAPTSISMLESRFSGHYNGFQVSVNKRYFQSLSMRASYTLGRAIDNINASSSGRVQDSGGFTGDYYNIDANIGPSSYDRTHRFVISYLWDLPRLTTKQPAVQAFLGGWSIAGVTTIQSGLPFSITDSRAGTIYGVASFGQFAPGMDAASVPLTGSTQSRLTSYFNTAAFGPPPALGNGTGFGNVPRNGFRGLGQTDFDIALSKKARVGGLTASGTLEIRAEAFNLFNTPQFGQPGTNANVPASFGVISSTVAGPRIMQLAIKYGF